jgi:hypothetical protein
MAFAILTQAQINLFECLQPSEQAHSLEIYHSLLDAHETNHDLLVAALLHDTGKSRFPLRIWERVVIVLCKRLFPAKVQDWGRASPQSWKRPFVIAEQHPTWGAELAQQAGASALAVSLIRRHQEPLAFDGDPALLSLEDRLLITLQHYDNES